MVLVQLEHKLGVCVLRPQFCEVKWLAIHLGGPLLLERRCLKLMLKIIHSFWPQNLIWALEWIFQRVRFFCNVTYNDETQIR